MAPLVIGSKQFNSQKDCENYVRNLFSTIGLCSSIKKTTHFDFIHDLVKRHPKYLEKCKNLKDFELVRNKFNKNAFELHLIRDDETVEDISWRICITGKTKTDKQLLFSALRYSIQEQIIEYKNNVIIENCMLCQKVLCNGDIHVDHIIHFEKIANDFLNISLKNRHTPTTFDNSNDNSNRKKFKKEDIQFENDWKIYHKKNSNLRLVCKKCNLTREKWKK